MTSIKTYTSKIAITVKNPYVIITNKVTSLEVGEPFHFRVNAIGLKNPDIVWKISDEKIGSIDIDTGEFLPKQAGQVKITAKDKNSGKTSVCYLEVIKPDISFGITNKVEEQWCNVSYKFKTRKAEKVSWSVSDTSMASINKDGVFVAKKVGTVTITAENTDTGEKISFEIKTKDIDESPVEIFDIAINDSSDGTYQGAACILGIKDKSYSEIKIPEKINGIDIKTIAIEAFAGEHQLKKVIIPASIEVVGDNAFYVCDNLESIVIQDRGTSLVFDLGSVADCKNMTEFITPYECKIGFGAYCFSGNISLKSIILPEGTIALGYGMFGDSDRLSELEVVIPNSLTYLGEIFGYVKNLKIVIPASVTEIAPGIFTGCKNVVIYTPKNSTAEQFARDNDIPYENY